MYKRQRKTSGCEAGICFSGAYNEQMSCEAGRGARSADLRVKDAAEQRRANVLRSR